MTEMLYLVAGRKEQADFFARNNEIPPNQFKYIYRREQLQGINISAGHLICVGTYWENPEWPEIAEMAQIRNLPLIFK